MTKGMRLVFRASLGAVTLTMLWGGFYYSHLGHAWVEIPAFLTGVVSVALAFSPDFMLEDL